MTKMLMKILFIFFICSQSLGEKLDDEFMFLNEPNIKSKSLGNENGTIITSDKEFSLTNNDEDSIKNYFYLTKFNESFNFEKYFHLDYKNFNSFCIEKKKFENLNLYLASKNRYVLIIDDNRLSFEFSFNKNYFPLIKKIPYKCTSYCEAKFKKNETDLSIRRIKIQSYLIEFLTKKNSTLVTFYLEDVEKLKEENSLVPALSFVIKKKECLSLLKFVNPFLDIHAVDNLLIQNLYKLFCHPQFRSLIIKNIPFVIQERFDPFSDYEEQLKEIFLDKNYFKESKLIFFNKTEALSFRLKSNQEFDSKIDFNMIKLKYDFITQNGLIQVRDDFSRENLFLSLDNDNFYLSHLEQNFFKLYNSHLALKTNTFFGCPQSFCYNSQIDALFTIPNCYLELLPQFKPKSKKVLVLFQKDFMYYINFYDRIVPTYKDGIPIDYLFHEVLKREDINFSNLDAAEYIEKSKIIIMFKNDEYLLLDPENLIVNGPFKIFSTFTSGPFFNINSVYFDDGQLVLIKDNLIVKYKWFAEDLSEKKKIDLENFISFNSPKIESKTSFKIDAILKHKEMNYYFTDQSYFISNDNLVSKQNYKDISSSFFKNCSNIKSRNLKLINQQHSHFAYVLKGFTSDPEPRKIDQESDESTKESSQKSNSFKISLNILIFFLLIFKIMF